VIADNADKSNKSAELAIETSNALVKVVDDSRIPLNLMKH
jgi:hypothetical protein